MAMLDTGAVRLGPRVDRDELDEIEGYYRWLLIEEPAVLPWAGNRWEPLRLGPTWQTENWLGVEHWVLPERTLGWECLAWSGKYLQESRGNGWKFTPEQARFLLHWYAVDENGRWLYRDFVLQRLKGWGKDPLAACLCLFELVGNCRVHDIDGTRVIGEDCPEAWVQTAAVAQKQTKNTMRLLPSLITDEARLKYGISPTKTIVYALRSTRLFEAITSSPDTLEGARTTFLLKNETQHWDGSNSGHDMQDVIERNATKSKGGAARTGAITNAFEHGKDSVGERDREAYEDSLDATKAGATRLLYDSLEAHEDAPLTEEAAPEVLRSVRGDSVWLDVPTIVDSIKDVRNPPNRSRRFWYNQARAKADTWMLPGKWDQMQRPGQIVLPGERVVAFFDGSKSEDTTGIVGCRLTDGLLWRIGAWSKPKGDEGREWRVDRDEVDLAVQSMMDTYKVVAFWGDPSHALDDDEAESYWDGLFDRWHERYARKLQVWAIKGGDRQHSVMWDMTNTVNQQMFTHAAMQMVDEVQKGELIHDGDRLLRRHVLNARRRPNKWGISIGKEHRSSRKKIDLAVCGVGARMLRRVVLNKGAGQRQRTGGVW